MIRLKLFKIGALVRVSVRRIKLAMVSACLYQNEFALAHLRLTQLEHWSQKIFYFSRSCRARGQS